MRAAFRALLYCAGGGIGDSLLASVLARALLHRYDAVDALTLPAHAQTLERVPEIGAVLADEGSEADLVRAIAHRGYGAVVVTWASARTARVAQLARIPVRCGQSMRLYSWRFTHRVGVRSERGDVTSHWSQILLDYARAIGCDTDDAMPRLQPTQNDRVEAAGLIGDLGLAEDRFAILHATNAVAPHRGIWPTRAWAQLARALQQTLGVPVLLSGSTEDERIVEQIARESGAKPIAGRLSIGGFAALAQKAKVFTGITTGSMHVAAAVGAPTVGIFPFQTDTPERWAPLGRRTAVVRASYPCPPGERKETCPDYACVDHLEVARIVAAAQSLVTPQ